MVSKYNVLLLNMNTTYRFSKWKKLFKLGRGY